MPDFISVKDWKEMHVKPEGYEPYYLGQRRCRIIDKRLIGYVRSAR